MQEHRRIKKWDQAQYPVIKASQFLEWYLRVQVLQQQEKKKCEFLDAPKVCQIHTSRCSTLTAAAEAKSDLLFSLFGQQFAMPALKICQQLQQNLKAQWNEQ